jgi:hypothetical protein
MPYCGKPLGILLFGESSDCRFRACTDLYPSPIAVVKDPNSIQQLASGHAHPRLVNDVMPVGGLYLGGNHNFVKFPQKVSFEHLVAETFKGISNRMLVEKQNPEILKERIYSILLYEPSFWIQGDDLPHEHYLKLLGYKDEDELGMANVGDIIGSVNRLLNDFIMKAERKDHLYRSYLMRCNHLFVALFALRQLDPTLPLGKLNYSVDKFWDYLPKGLDLTRNELVEFIPKVWANYRTMFEVNFPKLIPYSHFFGDSDKLSIIEIARESARDFIIISYILTKQNDMPAPVIFISTPYRDSITQSLHFKTKIESGYSISSHAGCGFITLDTTVNGIRLYDKQAWVVKTSFPSRTPLLDQVYQILFFDLEYILRAKSSFRHQARTSELTNSSYIEMIAKNML